MRRYAIFGNWKMNKPLGQARALAQSLKEKLGAVAGVELAVFPPAAVLGAVAEELRGAPVAVGAQNIHYESAGAFTGEISAEIARSAGATCVIVGHSERRHIFGETDEWINLKLKAALAAGLMPVVCVGETLRQREEGATREVVQTQVLAAFEGIETGHAAGIIVAYEPVWAIGTGKTATPEQAQAVHAFVRDLLAGRFGEQAASEVRIQYGGSVKPDNAAELLAQADIDGALVGGASLDAGSFAAIASAAAQRSEG
jgi:triosephosphate isomerase